MNLLQMSNSCAILRKCPLITEMKLNSNHLKFLDAINSLSQAKRIKSLKAIDFEFPAYNSNINAVDYDKIHQFVIVMDHN